MIFEIKKIFFVKFNEFLNFSSTVGKTSYDDYLEPQTFLYRDFLYSSFYKDVDNIISLNTLKAENIEASTVFDMISTSDTFFTSAVWFFKYFPDIYVCCVILTVLLLIAVDHKWQEDVSSFYEISEFVWETFVYVTLFFFTTLFIFFFNDNFSKYGPDVFLYVNSDSFSGVDLVNFSLYAVTCKFIASGLLVVIFFFWKDNIFWNSTTEKFLENLIFFLMAFEMINLTLSANNLILVIAGICGISVLTYILIAFDRTYIALEAALKYFSLSALVTGFMCFGYTLMLQFHFFVAAHTDYLLEVESNPDFFLSCGIFESFYFYEIGLIFFMSGFFFKLSLFPWHFWAPDVYDGSPILVVAFMVIVVKFVMFCLLLRFIVSYNIGFFSYLASEKFVNYNVKFDYQNTNILRVKQSELLNFFLKIVGVVSVIVGSLGAISQQKIKRFVAFTSINQMGLIFLGLLYDPNAIGSVFNLIVYCSTSIIIFAVLISMRQIFTKKSAVYMNELHSFLAANAYLVKCLTIGILSVSGIPPMLGFFSKYLIFLVIVKKHIIFAMIILAFHVVGTFNYLRLLRDLWFNSWTEALPFYSVMTSTSFNVMRVLAFFQVFPVILGMDYIIEFCFFFKWSCVYDYFYFV